MEFTTKVINMDFCGDFIVVLLDEPTDTDNNKVMTFRIDSK